jgi:hypothetical protein
VPNDWLEALVILGALIVAIVGGSILYNLSQQV